MLAYPAAFRPASPRKGLHVHHLKLLGALFGAALFVSLSACGPEPVECGDGIVSPGEACDDGNDNAADECVQCQIARCGDGVVQPGVEACDDGNTVETDGCRFDCTLPQCGDGIAQEGEACDGAALRGESCESAGFTGGTLACAANCAAFDTTACCGDGVIWGQRGV